MVAFGTAWLLHAAGADARARAVDEHAVSRVSDGDKLCNVGALGQNADARPCGNLRSTAGSSAPDTQQRRLCGPLNHCSDAPPDCSARSCVCHARAMACRVFGSRLPWSLGRVSVLGDCACAGLATRAPSMGRVALSDSKSCGGSGTSAPARLRYFPLGAQRGPL